MLKVILILLGILIGSQVSANEPKHILVLHSYHQSLIWIKNINRAINDVLEPDKNNYILHIENMDTKRIYTPEHLQHLKTIYRTKYKDIKFDLILSSDNNALDFLKENRNELFGSIPVAFCGINFFKPSDLDGVKHYTGTAEVVNAKDTIENALKMLPNTKEIYVINDYLKSGRAYEKSIQSQIASIDKKIMNNIKVNYAPNQSIVQLQQTMSKMKKETIILIGVYFKDKNGEYFSFREGEYFIYSQTGAFLAQSSPVPVFCLLKFNLHTGVIGGNVIDGYSQGEAMSKIALQILNGTPADNIPVLEQSVTRLIYDYPSLIHYGIDIDRVNKHAIFLNAPTSYWQQNKGILVVSIAIISLLALFIIILLITNKKRAIAENKFRQLSENLEITVKKRSHELFELTERMELALESANLGLWDWQPQSNQFSSNDIFLTMLGYSADDFAQTIERRTSLIHPDDSEPMMALLQPFIEGDDGLYSSEHRMLAADNRWHWIYAMGRVVSRDAQGKATRFIGIHLDITQRKHIEAQLIKSQKDAEMANKVKLDFLANMSHELRTPMQGILGFANLGLDKPELLSEEKTLKFLGYIKTSADRLMLLINDLLDLEKLESGKMTMNFTQGSLNSIVKSCVAEQYARLKEHNINTLCQADNIKGDGLFDPLRIGQVMTNFLSNAIKFTPQGSTIEFTIRQTEDYLEHYQKIIPVLFFSIKDEGQGISKDQCKIVFNKFEQGSEPDIGKVQGTGLGLAISKEIIDYHHGKIWAETHPDGGAVLSFIIPIEQYED